VAAFDGQVLDLPGIDRQEGLVPQAEQVLLGRVPQRGADDGDLPAARQERVDAAADRVRVPETDLLRGACRHLQGEGDSGRIESVRFPVGDLAEPPLDAPRLEGGQQTLDRVPVRRARERGRQRPGLPGSLQSQRSAGVPDDDRLEIGALELERLVLGRLGLLTLPGAPELLEVGPGAEADEKDSGDRGTGLDRHGLRSL